MTPRKAIRIVWQNGRDDARLRQHIAREAPSCQMDLTCCRLPMERRDASSPRGNHYKKMTSPAGAFIRYKIYSGHTLVQILSLPLFCLFFQCIGALKMIQSFPSPDVRRRIGTKVAQNGCSPGIASANVADMKRTSGCPTENGGHGAPYAAISGVGEPDIAFFRAAAFRKIRLRILRGHTGYKLERNNTGIYFTPTRSWRHTCTGCALFPE